MIRVSHRTLVAGLVLIGVVVFLVFIRDTPETTPVAPVPIVTVPPVTTSTPAPGAGTTTGPGTYAAAVTDTATRFVTAWASRKPNETFPVWRARMAPYASPVLLAKLGTAAPDAVQATKVTGRVDVVSVGQFGAEVVVPVDTGPAVRCTLASDGARWWVTQLVPDAP